MISIDVGIRNHVIILTALIVPVLYLINTMKRIHIRQMENNIEVECSNRNISRGCEFNKTKIVIYKDSRTKNVNNMSEISANFLASPCGIKDPVFRVRLTRK